MVKQEIYFVTPLAVSLKILRNAFLLNKEVRSRKILHFSHLIMHFSNKLQKKLTYNTVKNIEGGLEVEHRSKSKEFELHFRQKESEKYKLRVVY